MIYGLMVFYSGLFVLAFMVAVIAGVNNHYEFDESKFDWKQVIDFTLQGYVVVAGMLTIIFGFFYLVYLSVKVGSGG